MARQNGSAKSALLKQPTLVSGQRHTPLTAAHSAECLVFSALPLVSYPQLLLKDRLLIAPILQQATDYRQLLRSLLVLQQCRGCPPVVGQARQNPRRLIPSKVRQPSKKSKGESSERSYLGYRGMPSLGRTPQAEFPRVAPLW